MARGIICDTRCSICGAEKESINHVFFECQRALQNWALSKILSPPGIFPPLWCLLIWIISSGDYQKSMILVTFYGHCGIFGKTEII